MLTTKLIRLSKQDHECQLSLTTILRVLFGKTDEVGWLTNVFGEEDLLMAFIFDTEDEFKYGALFNFSKKNPSDFDAAIHMVDTKVKMLTKEMVKRWNEEENKFFFIEIRDNKILLKNEEDSGLGKTTDPTEVLEDEEEISQVYSKNPKIGEVMEKSDLEGITHALEAFPSGPRRYRSNNSLNITGISTIPPTQAHTDLGRTIHANNQNVTSDGDGDGLNRVLVAAGASTQGGAGMQGAPGIQGGAGILGHGSTQGSAGMQAAHNIQVGADIQGHASTQGGAGMQVAPDIQGGVGLQGHGVTQGGTGTQVAHGIQVGTGAQGRGGTQVGAGQVINEIPAASEDPIHFNRDITMKTIVQPAGENDFKGYRSHDATFNCSEDDEVQYHQEAQPRGEDLEYDLGQDGNQRTNTQFFSVMGTPYQSTPYQKVTLAAPKLVPPPRTSTLKPIDKSSVGFRDQGQISSGRVPRPVPMQAALQTPSQHVQLSNIRQQRNLGIKRQPVGSHADDKFEFTQQGRIQNNPRRPMEDCRQQIHQTSHQAGLQSCNISNGAYISDNQIGRHQVDPEDRNRRLVGIDNVVYGQQGHQQNLPAGNGGLSHQSIYRPVASHFLPQENGLMVNGQGRRSSAALLEQSMVDEREAFSQRTMTKSQGQPYHEEPRSVQGHNIYGKNPSRQDLLQQPYQEQQTINATGMSAGGAGNVHYRRPVVRISTMLPSEDADAEETIDALRDIMRLGYNEMEVIAAYLGSSDSFRDLRMSLSYGQKTSLQKFADVLRERKPIDPDIAQARFENIKQKFGEDEMDLWFRCVRLFNMSNGLPQNMAIGRVGQNAVRGRFINALRSDEISDKLRLDKVPYDQLVSRARELRLLSKHLRKSKDEKVMVTFKPQTNPVKPDVPAEGQRCKKHPTLDHLDKDCTRFKLCSICNKPGHDEPSCWFCNRCGYHHMQLDCRANAKSRANFNKRRNTARGGAQRVDGVPFEDKTEYQNSHLAQAGSDSDDLPEDYPFKDTRPPEFFGNALMWEPADE